MSNVCCNFIICFFLHYFLVIPHIIYSHAYNSMTITSICQQHNKKHDDTSCNCTVVQFYTPALEKRGLIFVLGFQPTANSLQYATFNISIYSNMAVMLSAQNCKVYFVSILKRDLDTNKTPSIQKFVLKASEPCQNIDISNVACYKFQRMVWNCIYQKLTAFWEQLHTVVALFLLVLIKTYQSSHQSMQMLVYGLAIKCPV